jgi:hypothetical protein
MDYFRCESCTSEAQATDCIPATSTEHRHKIYEIYKGIGTLICATSQQLATSEIRARLYQCYGRGMTESAFGIIRLETGLLSVANKFFKLILTILTMTKVHTYPLAIQYNSLYCTYVATCKPMLFVWYSPGLTDGLRCVKKGGISSPIRCMKT